MSDPTIDDVARVAGVSVATVSRALRGLPNVAETTRARVLDAAAALDYERHPGASRLASGRTLTIGVIAPRFGTWFPGRVLAAAEHVFAAAGYDLLLGAINRPAHLDPFLARAREFGRQVDGLLLIDLYLDRAALDRVLAANRPAVSIGERLDQISSLDIDNVRAARTATRHLVELGHRRIGLVLGRTEHDFASPVPDQRLAGFRAALTAADLDVDDSLQADGRWTVDGGAAAVEQILAAPDPPTAIFCMSDVMAIGARSRARELGLRVPDDLSIVGFDDHEMSAAFDLTTMRQDVDEMGRRGAEVLLEAVADQPGEPVHETAPVDLVQRGSTGAPETTRPDGRVDSVRERP